MKGKRLGNPFAINQEVAGGTSITIMLAKLENAVLLNIDVKESSMPGALVQYIYTFAPLFDGVATKGAIRFDKYDASTDTLSEGDDILFNIEPPLASNAGKENTYSGITRAKMEMIIHQLKASGARVDGNNPWNVDVNQHKIKLNGTWNEAASTLRIVVTNSAFYVPYSKIWNMIDSLIAKI